jgi:membrane associated rhomboid family serine protease
MNAIELCSILLALLTTGISYKGFQDKSFRDRYLFEVDEILVGKQYERLVTSGFLHNNWIHLIFNMAVLYLFSQSLSVFPMLNLGTYLVLYFGSMVGGNLLALYIHRNHGDYRALGASGAVNGLIFALIVMVPQAKIGFLFYLPGWIFGLLYILVSIYGIKRQGDNVGHEAHLGGAIVGILLAMAVYPRAIELHGWVIGLLLLPISVFLYLMVTRPEFLLIPGSPFGRSRFPVKKSITNPFSSSSQSQSSKGGGKVIPFISPNPSSSLSKEEELNHLLDKVREVGVEKLSKQERSRLEELSKEV